MRSLLLKIIAASVVIALVLIAGIRLGSDPGLLPAPLRGLTDHGTSSTWNQAVGLVKRDYYRPVSSAEIQNAGISGVVSHLHDRFSNYFDPAEYKAFQAGQNPHFSGIGLNVEFSRDGLKIDRVIEGTPAQKAGLKVGETIVAVNGKSLKGSRVENSTALIKGKIGTPVEITVRAKDGSLRTLKVMRAAIVSSAAASEVVTGPGGRKIGIVYLAGFVEGAGAQVAAEVASVRKKGAQAIILDLRGNGGGLLNEAVAVSSVFIANGTIVSTRGRNRAPEVYKANGHAIPASIPVVVLVDRGSASASEIVAGAIVDRHRGIAVGSRTFGKGVFQEVTELNNGGALDITVGEFFTPTGRNLGGGGVNTGAGITPNIKVPTSAGENAALKAAVAAAAARVK